MSTTLVWNAFCLPTRINMVMEQNEYLLKEFIVGSLGAVQCIVGSICVFWPAETTWESVQFAWENHPEQFISSPSDKSSASIYFTACHGF